MNLAFLYTSIIIKNGKKVPLDIYNLTLGCLISIECLLLLVEHYNKKSKKYTIDFKNYTKIKENYSYFTLDLATLTCFSLWFHKDIIVFVGIWYFTVSMGLKLLRYESTYKLSKILNLDGKFTLPNKRSKFGLFSYFFIMTFLICFFLSAYDIETKRNLLMLTEEQKILFLEKFESESLDS